MPQAIVSILYFKQKITVRGENQLPAHLKRWEEFQENTEPPATK